MDCAGGDADRAMNGGFGPQQFFNPRRDNAVIEPAERRDQRPSRLGRRAADEEHIAHTLAVTPFESQDGGRKHFAGPAALQCGSGRAPSRLLRQPSGHRGAPPSDHQDVPDF